jgi:hypothetical protein
MDSIYFGYVQRVIGVACLSVSLHRDDGSEFVRALVLKGFNPVGMTNTDLMLAYRATMLLLPSRTRIACQFELGGQPLEVDEIVSARVYRLGSMHERFAVHRLSDGVNRLEDAVNGVDAADVLNYLKENGFPKKEAFALIGRPLVHNGAAREL